MKLMLVLSFILSSLSLFQGCASGPAERGLANHDQASCHDISANSEDHHLNHCDEQPQ